MAAFGCFSLPGLILRTGYVGKRSCAVAGLHPLDGDEHHE
jgi:hypothetical protein